jgi:hypothetical protein
MSPVVDSLYGAISEAAERLITQLYSQSKLTAPRRENRKIRQENKIFKANEHAPVGQKLKIYRSK